ncbi:hypothetical protein [Hugenholtzia roseola]|uniref:hypothetical protein n=1 Tax=Hugenholtzia roseola TaxID=1002 RepID=UPI0003FF39F1|nr:hypothetical protein [Hugenholtzia roseola]
MKSLFSNLRYGFILISLLTFFSACGTKSTTQETNSSDTTATAPVETAPVEEVGTNIDPNREGGSFTIEIDGKSYPIKTEHADNGFSYDAANKNITLMAGSADNNLTITLAGGESGEFVIGSAPERSASLTVNVSENGTPIFAGTLSEGKFNLESFNKADASAKGSFEGKTAEGKALKGTFELNFANRM